MSDDNATENQQRKRVRFDEKEDGQKTTSPAQALQSYLSSTFESLHPTIARVCSKHCTDFVKLRNKIRNQQSIIEKLEQGKFIPKSCKSSFKLGASSKVTESAEFKTLAENAEKDRVRFEETMRNYVLACAKLEMTRLVGELQQVFLKGATNICDMIVMQSTLKKNTQMSKWLMITSIKDKPEVLAYSGFKEDGKEITLLDIDEFLGIVFQQFHPDDTDLLANKFALSTEQYGAVHLFSATCGDYMDRVFSRSWKSQLGIYDAKDLQLELDKFALEQLEGSATKDTAEAMDVEQTVDSKTINELIQQKITQENKATKNTISQLRDEIRRLKAKKDGGGAQESASSKKKSPKKTTIPSKNAKTKNTTSNKKQQKEKDKAGESNKDSPAGKKTERATIDKEIQVEKKSSKTKGANKKCKSN